MRPGDHDRADLETPDLEIVVRATLQARADAVALSPDALATIRARTSRRRRSWAVGLTSLATAATAAAVATVVALSGGPAGPDAVPPAGTGSARPSGSVQPAPPADRVPVYYTAPVDGQLMLYREFHPAAVGPSLTDRIRVAVSIMLAGQPFDPDYGSQWPAGVSLAGVRLDTSGGKGTVAVVDLTGTMPAGTAGATALQQLVYTVTAVSADRGVQLVGVMVRHDGADWIDTPLTRGAAAETLAPVWLISPQDGASVGTTVDIHVAGILAKPVRLEVRDAAGRMIKDLAVPVHPLEPTAASPTVQPSRGEAHVAVDLAPGRYTVEVYLSTGDGVRSDVDNHTITVVRPAG